MKKLLCALILPILGLTGCTPPPAAKPDGTVALIDLEAVAKRLGRDTVIAQEIKEASEAIAEQLVTAQKEYQAEFTRYKDTLGAKPTEADNQKLVELNRNLNAQFQQRQQQAQQEIAAKRTALVNRFCEEVKPLAMKVAAARGLQIVLVKSDLVVLGYEPTVEITDAVVAEMTRGGGSSLSASPSPSATAR